MKSANANNQVNGDVRHLPVTLAREEIEQLRQLLHNADELVGLAERHRAISMMSGMTMRIAGWIAAISGAALIGWDALVNMVQRAAS